jgi:HEPN domain-containing protein
MTKNTDRAVKFWLDSAKDNFETAKLMLKAGRWNFAMFMCQQSIEALLKAVVIRQTDCRPPYVHELGILLKATEIEIPVEIWDKIKEIDRHYIKARYFPDRFNPKIYNQKSANSLLKKTGEVIKWFTKKLNLEL